MTGDGGDAWAPGSFWISTEEGVDRVSGYVRKGMGLRHHGWATPLDWTEWTLTHLGSGAAVMDLAGRVAVVFPVASEVADCTDWTAFDLASGWRQVDPDLIERLAAIVEKHRGVVLPEDDDAPLADDDSSRQVVAVREASDAG